MDRGTIYGLPSADASTLSSDFIKIVVDQMHWHPGRSPLRQEAALSQEFCLPGARTASCRWHTTIVPLIYLRNFGLQQNQKAGFLCSRGSASDRTTSQRQGSVSFVKHKTSARLTGSGPRSRLWIRVVRLRSTIGTSPYLMAELTSKTNHLFQPGRVSVSKWPYLLERGNSFLWRQALGRPFGNSTVAAGIFCLPG